MAQWFGDSWGAPVCDPETHVATPVGDLCTKCNYPVLATDRGMILPYRNSRNEAGTVTYHRVCFMKETMGPDYKRYLPPDDPDA